MSTVLHLRNLGFDVVHLREQDLHRMPDPKIVAKAQAEERIILTFDLDFGELLTASGERTPSVAVCRFGDAGNRNGVSFELPTHASALRRDPPRSLYVPESTRPVLR